MTHKRLELEAAEADAFEQLLDTPISSPQHRRRWEELKAASQALVDAGGTLSPSTAALLNARDKSLPKEYRDAAAGEFSLRWGQERLIE